MTDSSLVKLAVDIMSLSKPVARMTSEVAKSFLGTDNTPATLVYHAVLKVLGPTAAAWEPESIWLGLKDNGIDLNQAMRNKFMAASTLLQNPSFYEDMHIFEDTCLAFNESPVIVEVLQEASPAQLAWGVYEAEVFMRQHGLDPDFDYEPEKYTAAALHNEGFIVAPELLVFAQDELDKLNRGNKELYSSVLDAWDRADKAQLSSLKLEENPTDVQVAKLAAVHLYVDGRANNYNMFLRKLL